MQTLYIDVYFLINFSLDALALYFALRLTHSHSSIVRLLLCSGLLSLLTCIYTVYFEREILGYLLLIVGYTLAVFWSSKGASVFKKITLGIFFFVISFLLGGIVFWGYEQLGKLLKNFNMETNNGAENKKFLFFAVIVLIAVSFVRVFILLYENNKNQRTLKISFVLFGKKYTLDALVDSGSFLREPLSGSPVLLVKSLFVSLPFSPDERTVFENADEEVKKRVRLVPAHSLGNSKMLVGFILDGCMLEGKNEKGTLTLCVAIDNEGGTYGGYGALVPSFVLDYVD